MDIDRYRALLASSPTSTISTNSGLFDGSGVQGEDSICPYKIVDSNKGEGVGDPVEKESERSFELLCLTSEPEAE